MSRHSVAVVGPTSRVARELALRLAPRLAAFRVAPYSLGGFLADRKAPSRIVIGPSGRLVGDDVRFLEEVRRRALWSTPGAELAGAIAGLRGDHDSLAAGPAPPRGGRGRTTALLLEGDVTRARAARAVDSGAPRNWIVERVQNVRIPAAPLAKLRALGIRWSVLEPIEVVALAASSDLARSPARWASRLPAGVPVWTIKMGTDLFNGQAKDPETKRMAK